MTKYDDLDYHLGDAMDKGQPDENAFTHIAFMLSWLIRRDLGEPEFFESDIVRRVKDRSLRPNDLSPLVDGQLVDDMLKPEGSTFLDSYYAPGYLEDYQAEFVELPDYGVSDDPEHEARIDARIDSAYERWVDAGRPGPGEPAALWD